MTALDDLHDAYALIRDHLEDETLRQLLAQLEMRHVIAHERETNLTETLLQRALHAKDIHARH